MAGISNSPQIAGFLAAAIWLAGCAGCCCGQGWVVAPESAQFDDSSSAGTYHHSRPHYEGNHRGACGHGGRHHGAWLHGQNGMSEIAVEELIIPYPKFHPVPAGPVFGTPTLASWPVPAEPPLHLPLPRTEQEPPPPPAPAPLPSQSGEESTPAGDPSQPPQLLGTPSARASWVFPPPAVKRLTASSPTRRLVIPQPESRQALQERMQPIRK